MDLLRLHSLNIQTVQLNQCPFTVGNLQNSKGFANKRPQLLSQPRKRSNLRVLPVLDNSRRCNLQSLQALCTSNGNILETGAHESVMADEHTSLLEKKGNEVVKDLKGSCIYLLGMMGSGKSTVGRILAEALGYYFFDSDKLVEEAAGVKSVAQIIKEDEESFRNAETEVLKQLSCMGRLVVATGGGIVARPIN